MLQNSQPQSSEPQSSEQQSVEHLPKRQGIILAVLILLLGYTFLLHSELRKESSFNNKSKQAAGWQQPEQANTNYPNRIGEETWSFNFDSLEVVVSRLKVDDKGNLVVNAETEKSLVLTATSLPHDLSQEDLTRVSFLIKKASPNGPGNEFANLLEKYLTYLQRLTDGQLKINEDNGPSSRFLSELPLLRNQLQAEVFGPEISKKIFHRKNLTSDYLLRRKAISLDKILNKSQKKQQLYQLKQAYSSELDNLKAVP